MPKGQEGSQPDSAQGGGIGRREATSHGVHVGATGPPQNRIHREPLPQREAAPRAGQPAATPRKSNQNLVPEQEGQDQENHRAQEPTGPAAHGPGTLQPLHCPR